MAYIVGQDGIPSVVYFRDDVPATGKRCKCLAVVCDFFHVFHVPGFVVHVAKEMVPKGINQKKGLECASDINQLHA